MKSDLQLPKQRTHFGVHGHVNIAVLELLPEVMAKHAWKFAALEALSGEIAALSEGFDAAYSSMDDAALFAAVDQIADLESKRESLRASLPSATPANSYVVREDEWDNLILDSGLDQLASTSAASVFTYCAVGTGNATPLVSQQGLVTESARTNNYLTSGGGCGTTQPNNFTWVLKRTFDFPLAALNGTYAEVGFSPVGSAGANLYNRSLIQSSGVPTAVTVSSSQQLRVVFTHTVTVSPLTITRNVPEINGWTTVTSSGATTASQSGTTVTSSAGIFGAGDVNKAIKFANGVLAIITVYTSTTSVQVDRTQTVAAQTFSLLTGTEGAQQFQSLGGLIGTVDAGGNNSSGTGYLEPSRGSIAGFVSASAIALPSTAGTTVDRSGSANTDGTYNAQTYLGGFTRDYKMPFTVNQANQTIRSYGAGNSFSGPFANAGTLVELLDVNQTKSSLFTLELILALTWGRG